VTFGSSSKTSDCIVDTLAAWWQRLSATEHSALDRVQINMDNGSESSGVRTQLLHRIVQLVDAIGKPIQLLYYPSWHSKYKPIEHCWGMMERYLVSYRERLYYGRQFGSTSFFPSLHSPCGADLSSTHTQLRQRGEEDVYRCHSRCRGKIMLSCRRLHTALPALGKGTNLDDRLSVHRDM